VCRGSTQSLVTLGFRSRFQTKTAPLDQSLVLADTRKFAYVRLLGTMRTGEVAASPGSFMFIKTPAEMLGNR